MMDAQLRSLVKQAEALAEQATALGMQAETLKRTVQAALAQDNAEAPPPSPVVQAGPAPKRYLNGYTPPEPAPAPGVATT